MCLASGSMLREAVGRGNKCSDACGSPGLGIEGHAVLVHAMK
jgi:hypothetical protein